MSAFVPPPPDVASSAGAHALPFHFKTWPDVAPVFTSDKSVNDAAAIRASALALVKYKFEPSAIPSVSTVVNSKAFAPEFTLTNLEPAPTKLFGESVSPTKVDAPPPPPTSEPTSH